jgi:predicted NBD/HSP70 family sugar kinase
MDQIRKRNENREAILRALHFEGPLRRGALSARLGIRKSSVTSLSSELLAAGLVDETRPGAPRSPLRIDVRRHHVAAARLTAGHLHVGRVGLDGMLRDEKVVTLRSTPPGRTIRVLASELGRLMAPARGRTVGVGIALPGLVDPEAGVVTYSSVLGGWRDVPLAMELGRRIGRRVRIDNDVRCQLWAGAWFGRLLRGAGNILYVGILDGVACSLILHGRRVVGGRHAAGEVGHVRAGDERRRCACGKTDCLETYCSLPAIAADVRKRQKLSRIDGADALARLAATDGAVRDILAGAASRVARVLAPVLAAVDPEVVVLGSASRAFSEALQPLLDRALRAELVGAPPRKALLRIGEPEVDASLKGAAGLVLEEAYGTGEILRSAPARRRA